MRALARLGNHLVDHLVAHAAVKALREAALHRLARRVVSLLQANLPPPWQRRSAGELRAVVSNDRAGPIRSTSSCTTLDYRTMYPAPFAGLHSHIVDDIKQATLRHVGMQEVEGSSVGSREEAPKPAPWRNSKLWLTPGLTFGPSSRQRR